MFNERDIFCSEYAASDQVQMACYLSMLKIEIHDFVSNQRYSSLFEMQSLAWKREIKI